MRLKKRFSLFLLIALVVWAVPYFMGQYFEIRYYKTLVEFSEFEGIKLSSAAYKRGWLKSSATTKVELTNPDFGRLKVLFSSANQKFDKNSTTIILHHNIWHGPFIKLPSTSYKEWIIGQAYVKSNIVIDENIQSLIRPKNQSNQLLSLIAKVEINGDINITIDGQALDYSKDDQKIFSYQGLQGEWYLLKGLTLLRGHLVLPGFELNHQGYYAGESISLKAERNYVDGAWAGKALLQAKSLKAKQTGASDIVLNNFAASKSAEVQNKALSVRNTLKIDAFTYDHTTYGPVLLDISANRLPVFVYQLLKRLQNQKVNGMTILARLVEKMPQLLAYYPEIIIQSIDVQTPEGNIEGKVQLGFDKDAQVMLANGEDVSHMVLIRARLSAPVTAYKHMIQYLVESNIIPLQNANKNTLVETLATQWIKEGYVEQKGNHIELDLIARNGLMLFHGVEKSGDIFWQLPKVLAGMTGRN